MIGARAEFRDENHRVRAVASAREESEFDLFAAAWEAWHGSAPPDGRMEQDFGDYLRGGSPPPYVRHFVRQWLRNNPGLRRRRAADRRAERRARLFALAIIVFAVIVAMLIGSRM